MCLTVPYTLNPNPEPPTHKPITRNPNPQTPIPEPQPFAGIAAVLSNPKIRKAGVGIKGDIRELQVLNPKPYNLNPKPQNPKPRTEN